MKARATEPTKHVGIWIRVSTDDQAQGDSPAHHEHRAREYAKFNQWNVREVYDLAGVSGKTVMEHPEAKRMLADIKRGHISAIIFSKLARLARNTKELLEFSDLFRKHGADMVSLQEKIDTSSPAGRLFYTMIAAMAQWEREEIGDRVKASVSVRARLGKPLNGSSPYGYRWVNKKLTVDPDEAVVAKKTFELFVQHRRKGRVARLLNDAGHRTRTGAKWSDTAVSRVLVQPAASGTYIYNLTKKTGDWKVEYKPEDQWSRLGVEAIISPDLWHQTTRILEELAKTSHRIGRPPVRIFASITVCECGKKMYVPSGSRKYTCVKCKNKILADDLESIFYDELKGYFQDTKRITAHLMKARQSLAEKEARLAGQRTQIEKVRAKIASTHLLYTEGQIPLASFKSFHEPLDLQLRQLQDELARLEGEVDHFRIHDLSAEEVLREAGSLYSTWPQMTVEEKQRIVQSIAERIVVGKDEIEINFSHLPSSEEITKSQQLV